jgi:hypothetical protein
MAALSSRWCRAPHPVQVQCSSHPMSCTCPQAWQVLDDGYHRSAITVGLGESGGQDVEVVAADARDPTVQPGDLLLGFEVAPDAARPLP